MSGEASNILAMSSPHTSRSLLARLQPETGDAILRYELLEEQAHSLGRAGRKVEVALATLSAHPGGEGRAALVKEAADAVWGFLVQREVMGLRDRAAVIAQYGIPREVLAKVGAR